MEEAPENGKESSHSAHANGMNECILHILQFVLLGIIRLHLVFCTERNSSETISLSKFRFVVGISWIC